MRIMAALEKDKYRKPRTGMIDYLRMMYEDKGWKIGRSRHPAARHTLTADWNTAVYVGDAAGRKGDHSNTDNTKALNARNNIVTPQVVVKLQ